MRIGRRIGCAGFVTAVLAGTMGLRMAGWAQENEVKPTVSTQPLTVEQLSVYRYALKSWYGKDKIKVNLAAVTDPFNGGGVGDDKECIGKLDFEPLPKSPEVHRIRREDLAQLGDGQFQLIEPDLGAKEVRENDPGEAIRQGKPVDAAVDNGFAHGLFSFSEIHFNAKHTIAVVSFSFVCGGLCGHGTTLVMEKQKDGSWKPLRTCGDWIS